ncbi:MAG: hypothetical protein AB1640_16335 [bacterium]
MRACRQRDSDARDSTAAAGGSLAELVVGLALVGLLGAVGGHALHETIPSARCDRAIRGIGSLLEWARWRAVQEAASHKIALDPVQNCLTVYREKETETGRIEERVGGLDLPKEYPGVVLGAAEGVPRTSGCASVDATGIHFAHRYLRFLPTGSADRCGSLYLIPARDLPGRKDRMRAISVILATGRVQMWAFDPLAESPCGGLGAWHPLF